MVWLRAIDRRIAVAALLVLASASTLSCVGAEGRPSGLRVVLITLDTTRADALLTDEEPAPLEHLSGWARQGLVFAGLYAPSGETQPSHATMFTGMHPWRHGVLTNPAPLPRHLETVAERLGDAGFETGAVVASFPLERRFGFAQGFDLYFDELIAGPLAARRGFSPAEFVAQQADRMLDELSGDKQFLWLHFFDPHAPYGFHSRSPKDRLRPSDVRIAITDHGADPEEVLARARHLYDEDVRIMDRQVDRLLRRLEEESSRFETHIVIVADHGENFGETGSLGHGRRLTRMDLHVPLIILSPDVEPGMRAEPVGMVDVPATLLDLAGVASDLGTSRSLLEPDVRRQIVGMQRPFIEPFEEIRIDGSTHVLEGLRFFSMIDGRLYMGNSSEVFLEEMEPGELEPERIAELKSLFATFESELGDPESSPVDDEVLEQMRALGYIQ